MGVGDVVGSLTPGKRADLIMVDTRAVNLAVFTEPAHLLVEAAQPANVDTVIIDGRIVKRGGRLTTVDVGDVVDDGRPRVHRPAAPLGLELAESAIVE